MKISISRRDYRDKNHIDWKNVCYKEIEVNGLSSLNWYISKGYCYCAIFKHDGDILRQSDKTVKNFIQTNIISIDLDDRDQTYKIFTDIMRGTDIMPSLIYTTANNGIKGNRYRALYVTDNPITSTPEYCSIYNGLVKEIASHANEPMKDNCGHSVAQQMAGNGTPTFQSTLGDIWSLAELKERYNVNDVKNEDVSSMTDNENENENVKSITRLNNKKSYIIKDILYNNIKKREKHYTPCDTFEEIEELPFIQDYYNLSIHDIVTKYMDVYPSIEATPITFEDDELYKFVDDDYLELKRGGYFNKVTMKNGNEVTMWTPRKRKNGERRKKYIFLNLLIRRMICPTATFDYLLHNALYELDYYTDNTKEPITKYEIAQIAANAYLEDLNKWQKLKEWNRKKFKVNKDYCKKNGMDARRVALDIGNKMKKAKSHKQYERIKELFNIELTDKQNIDELEKKGIKISIITLKRWKKANGIRKNKKRVTAQSQTTCKAVGGVKSTSMDNLSTQREETQQRAREVAKTERERKFKSYINRSNKLYNKSYINIIYKKREKRHYTPCDTFEGKNIYKIRHIKQNAMDLTEQFPYPLPKKEKGKHKKRATKEEGLLVTAWCRNPQRVRGVIKKFHIWSINHQQYADEENHQYVKENIEDIKTNLGI